MSRESRRGAGRKCRVEPEIGERRGFQGQEPGRNYTKSLATATIVCQHAFMNLLEATCDHIYGDGGLGGRGHNTNVGGNDKAQSHDCSIIRLEDVGSWPLRWLSGSRLAAASDPAGNGPLNRRERSEIWCLQPGRVLSEPVCNAQEYVRSSSLFRMVYWESFIVVAQEHSTFGAFEDICQWCLVRFDVVRLLTWRQRTGKSL